MIKKIFFIRGTMLFCLNLFLFYSTIVSCNSTKQLSNQETVNVAEPKKEADSLIVLNHLIALKDSLLERKAMLKENQQAIYKRINAKKAELTEHDKEFRHNSPEYKAMLPTYLAVAKTRDAPEYKKLTGELGKAQEQMLKNPEDDKLKKAYDDKFKEFQKWEETSGRAALKTKLLPLRAEFIAAERKSGRVALGEELRAIEGERIQTRDELKKVETQISEVEAKILAFNNSK